MINRLLALLVATLLGVLFVLVNHDHRLDRIEHATFVCHPIQGSLSGDRVCVAP